MARFRLIEKFTPTMLKGASTACSNCNLDPATKRGVVSSDTTFVEFTYNRTDDSDLVYLGERKLELCMNCVEHIAAMIGCLAPDESASLKAQVFQAEAARAKAERSQAAAEKALAGMQDWLADGES